jgi:hypothetical protein
MGGRSFTRKTGHNLDKLWPSIERGIVKRSLKMLIAMFVVALRRVDSSPRLLSLPRLIVGKVDFVTRCG